MEYRKHDVLFLRKLNQRFAFKGVSRKRFFGKNVKPVFDKIFRYVVMYLRVRSVHHEIDILNVKQFAIVRKSFATPIKRFFCLIAATLVEINHVFDVIIQVTFRTKVSTVNITSASALSDNCNIIFSCLLSPEFLFNRFFAD